MWQKMTTELFKSDFDSKREAVSIIIALLLDNLYKNRDTFIQILGWGSLNHKGPNK